MTSEHCCRLNYLVQQFGLEHFNLLYFMLPDVNVCHIILSYLPDAKTKKRYRRVIREIKSKDDVIVYSYCEIRNRWSWNWDYRWEVGDNLLDRFNLPCVVWEKFKSCRMVCETTDTIQFDDERWHWVDLEEIDRLENIAMSDSV